MVESALQNTVARLLRPLVRILLRHGISFADFAEVARRVFVEVADEDFRLPGRKQTQSRISMLTGIHRKEVARLQSLPPIETDALDLQYNRGVRVTSGWRRDETFTDVRGRPLALPFDGELSFTELARRYSGDLPARAVLDELLRVGTVLRDGDGLIRLQDDAVHTPHEDTEAQINILGHVGRDVFRTIDHNLTHSAPDKRLQLTVAYNNLPENAVRRFQHISHEDSLALLRKFDAWLAEHDRDASSGVPQEGGRHRAGIGIYYFEEEVQ